MLNECIRRYYFPSRAKETKKQKKKKKRLISGYIDPDKVYDYHTAFDIKPTQVVYNVDINANNKKILNINLDRNSNNSAATVGMVKEIHPFTTNILYRKYFEEVYDFTDANIYRLNRGSSGVVFNSLDSITGNPTRDIGIPNRTIDDVRKEGINVSTWL